MYTVYFLSLSPKLSSFLFFTLAFTFTVTSTSARVDLRVYEHSSIRAIRDSSMLDA